jgi:hypothetical protein
MRVSKFGGMSSVMTNTMLGLVSVEVWARLLFVGSLTIRLMMASTIAVNIAAAVTSDVLRRLVLWKLRALISPLPLHKG